MTITQELRESYEETSPYYASVQAAYGDTLDTVQLEHVLAEHGLGLSDYQEDGQESRDTLAVVLWLGY